MPMRLNRLGHASLLVETETNRLLIDPGVFSSESWGERDLDVVMITHEHPDHFDREHVIELLAANPNAPVVAPPSVCDSLRDTETELRPMDAGSTLDLGRVHIEVLSGEHAVVHERIPRIANLGFVLNEGSGPRVFHPGDSYAVIPSGIDVLAVPLTAPWSNVAATVEFLESVSPERAFPIHDAHASGDGHATYMRIIGGLIPEALDLMTVERLGSFTV